MKKRWDFAGVEGDNQRKKGDLREELSLEKCLMGRLVKSQDGGACRENG